MHLEFLIVQNVNHAQKKIKINSECCFVEIKNNKLIYKCIKSKKEWKRPLSKLKAVQAYINFAMVF